MCVLCHEIAAEGLYFLLLSINLHIQVDAAFADSAPFLQVT